MPRPLTSLTLAFALIAVVLVPPATAQKLVWKNDWKQPPSFRELAPAKAAEAASPPAEPQDHQVVRIAAMPAAEVQPALRYQLWPRDAELTDGDTGVSVMRALILQRNFSGFDKVEQEFAEKQARWLTLPVAELQVDEIKRYLRHYQSTLEELRGMTRLRHTGLRLQIGDRSGPELVNYLLPEYQSLRSLARLLRIEARLAIAEGRFDDAIETIGAGYRLAEFAFEYSDFMIAQLVGFALQSIMRSTVEDLIQAPNSPNMYWALATLPKTMSNYQRAVATELLMISRSVPELEPINPNLHSEEFWNTKLLNVIENLPFANADKNSDGTQHSLQSRMLASATFLGYSDRARVYLRSTGVSRERVDAMPSSEAVLRAVRGELDTLCDNQLKWALLPESQRHAYLGRSEQVIQHFRNSKNPAAVLVRMLAPTFRGTANADLRVRQQRAMLITVEALRDHAARNDGVLPGDLEQLANLPAWHDPATQQPFTYRRLNLHEARLERTVNGETHAQVYHLIVRPASN